VSGCSGLGSGKSTLLHLLTGLLRPQRGTIERSNGAGPMPSLVFQFPERQLFAETVAEDVGYGLRESGVARAEVASRIEEALAEVGLPPAEFATRVPFHLSGGEMRRVALAGALAQRRQLLLLDEPTLGLDAEGLDRLRDILDGVHARGVAYWMASHDVDFVCATCDRVVVLDAGGVACSATPAEFWGDPGLAARLGVDTPRTAALAARLRGVGWRDSALCRAKTTSSRPSSRPGGEAAIPGPPEPLAPVGRRGLFSIDWWPARAAIRRHLLTTAP